MSEEDLDKTVVDVRIQDLSKHHDEILGDTDETVMVRVPMEKEIPEPTPAPEPEPKKPEKKKPEKQKKPKAPKPPPAELPAAVEAGAFSLPFWILNGLVFLFLAAGLLEALRSASPLRLPAMVAAGVAFLFLLGSLLKKIPSRGAFLWAAVVWFAWYAYAAYYFFTSQTPYFLNFSLAQVTGIFLAFLSAVVLLFIYGISGIRPWAKIFALLGFFLVGTAFILSLASGRSLEGNLWGPSFFSGLPIFLRPGVLALMAGFPLQVLAILLALRGFNRQGSGPFKNPAVPLLLMVLMASFLGAKLLSRQGVQVPLLGSLTGENFSGSTLLDPKQNSIRLVIAQDQGLRGSDQVFPLTLAANLPVVKGKSAVSRLMVRNPEGLPFVRKDLSKSMDLLRGDLKMKGGKIFLDESRLGQARISVLVVDGPLPSPSESSLRSALNFLGYQLSPFDSLYLSGPGGLKKLKNPHSAAWDKNIDSALKGEGTPLTERLTEVFNKILKERGFKQIILIQTGDQLYDAGTRSEWSAQAKKKKVALDFLAVGALKSEAPEVYQADDPSQLGFGVLSAAATNLGDYRLEYPKLPPLPRISLTRNPDGQVQIQEGRINFEILSADPADIQALRFKVDNENPIDLTPDQLSQSVELERLKVQPGKHQFSIQVLTKEGDEILEKFSGDYVAKRSVQFVKPLDRDTIGGVFNIMISPGRIPGLTVKSIDLFVDGIPSGMATTEPYLMSLDSANLEAGEHKLQAVQTYSDGKSESVELTVVVNPSAPMVKIVRPGNGEFLSNLAEIEAEVGGGLLAQIEKIDYYVDGKWMGESTQAPHRFLWSNNQYPPGKYFIQARAQLESHATTTDAVEVQLAQSEVVVQADPAQNPTGELFPDNLEVLLDASTSMREPFGPSLKIDLAKGGLTQLAEILPKNIKILTRVFGAGAPASYENCQDSFALKKPKEEMAGIQPRGVTPLSFALERMAKELSKTTGSRVGLVIADGWEQCGGDPIKIAESMAKGKNPIRLGVLYFNDVGPTQASLLKRLAEITGGKAYPIQRPEDLVEALRDSVQVNFSLFDFRNEPVLRQSLSAEAASVRAGEYRLEVDTDPPLVKDGLKFPPGTRKNLQVVKTAEGFELREE